MNGLYRDYNKASLSHNYSVMGGGREDGRREEGRGEGGREDRGKKRVEGWTGRGTREKVQKLAEE